MPRAVRRAVTAAVEYGVARAGIAAVRALDHDVIGQAHHPRVRVLSLGINVDEPIIKPPLPVDWDRYLPRLTELGWKLPGKSAQAPGG